MCEKDLISGLFASGNRKTFNPRSKHSALRKQGKKVGNRKRVYSLDADLDVGH